MRKILAMVSWWVLAVLVGVIVWAIECIVGQLDREE